jgi:aminopeptidase N
MTASKPQTIFLKDYQQPNFWVEHAALTFELEPAKTKVLAKLSLKRNQPGSLYLDGEDLKLLSVKLDGQALDDQDYTITAGGLSISAPITDNCVLETVVEIDPAANSRLEGLYVSSGNFCTQCEAEGFRRITFYPDRPDVMATFDVTVIGEKAAYPVLLSNGNLTASEELPDGRHRATWQDPFPKPAYLFALVAGDLGHVQDHFVTRSGRRVELNIYVDKGNEDRCDYAMDSLKRSMRWDEEKYGLEYDLDIFNIVAVADFNMGAMENKSLNIFNAKYVLANADTATDVDYAGIEAVIAHEYFHNWTGNRVTCRDWFQLSLKEGLTVFRDQQFSADMRSAPVKRIQDVTMLRGHQFPEDAGPMAHPIRPDEYIEINNFYTPTVYEKGAEVIRMFHTLLGEGGFRKGIDLYFARHDGQAVTCDDFAAAMADANDTNLDQFKLWYSQAGTPEIKIADNYDGETGRYTLTINQHQPDTPGQSTKKAMHIPIAVGLLDKEGNEVKSTEILNLTASEQSFVFDDLPQAPIASVNRGFSAPVKVRVEEDNHAFLMAHDSDPFNRFEAGQQYATTLLLDMVPDPAKAIPASYLSGYRLCLEAKDLDKAYQAQLLSLPSQSYIGDQMEAVDVAGIHAARESLRKTLAESFTGHFHDLYHGNQSNEIYSPDAEGAGRRALKNCALYYLAALKTTDSLNLLIDQFESADNMTDRMAALQCLNEWDVPERQAALDAFYTRFKDDDLTIDKWFTVQATSPLPDTLDKVKALLDHPAFNIRQPNKVRALISGFTSGNILRFHEVDGSGYDFLASKAIELDSQNPQIAARMLAPLGRWRRYDKDRQLKMKAALGRVRDKSDLSRDVFEVVEKSLA